MIVSYSHRYSGWCIYEKVGNMRPYKVSGPYPSEGDAYKEMHAMGRKI